MGRKRIYIDVKCVWKGCGKVAVAKFLCRKHYQRQLEGIKKHKDKKKVYAKGWYKKIKTDPVKWEKWKQTRKRWVEKNRDRLNAYMRKRYHDNKEKRHIYNKKYENKQKKKNAKNFDKLFNCYINTLKETKDPNKTVIQYCVPRKFVDLSMAYLTRKPEKAPDVFESAKGRKFRLSREKIVETMNLSEKNKDKMFDYLISGRKKLELDNTWDNIDEERKDKRVNEEVRKLMKEIAQYDLIEMEKTRQLVKIREDEKRIRKNKRETQKKLEELTKYLTEKIDKDRKIKKGRRVSNFFDFFNKKVEM